MSQNAYALFQKWHFAKWGGNQKLVWNGGCEGLEPNTGRTELWPKAARFRVPPSLCFGHLPYWNFIIYDLKLALIKQKYPKKWQKVLLYYLQRLRRYCFNKSNQIRKGQAHREGGAFLTPPLNQTFSATPKTMFDKVVLARKLCILQFF